MSVLYHFIFCFQSHPRWSWDPIRSCLPISTLPVWQARTLLLLQSHDTSAQAGHSGRSAIYWCSEWREQQYGGGCVQDKLLLQWFPRASSSPLKFLIWWQQQFGGRLKKCSRRRRRRAGGAASAFVSSARLGGWVQRDHGSKPSAQAASVEPKEEIKVVQLDCLHLIKQLEVSAYDCKLK